MIVQKHNQQKLKTMSTAGITSTIILGFLLLTGFVVLGMWGCPIYKVYQQKKEGESLLAHAQSAKEVAVAEAKAKMESAALLAEADTIRAHGIARSNQIIGQSLTDAYLHWFWIDNIDKSNNVMYIPTENGLPKFNLPLNQSVSK